MTLDQLVTDYLASKASGGVFLTTDELNALAVQAARKYAAYGFLSVDADGVPFSPLLSDITLTIDMSTSAWGVVSRLFYLYAERESALRLEATRGLGLDVYGRAVSEVSSDITAYEQDLPRLAFCEDPISIGL